jgi:hypothetical protein
MQGIFHPCLKNKVRLTDQPLQGDGEANRRHIVE